MSRLFGVCLLCFSLFGCEENEKGGTTEGFFTFTPDQLKDKIKGAWAMQTIGATYGSQVAAPFLQQTIPDSVTISWSDSLFLDKMTRFPEVYDDISLDLTLMEVLDKKGLDAPAEAFAEALTKTGIPLHHANQTAVKNILSGMEPPVSGFWQNNPHADDMDFQREADFIGLMCPGMPIQAAKVCDKVGHVMSSGDGYFGGVFVAVMHTYAYILEDIKTIITRANDAIPGESSFHQCIEDVLQWQEAYPGDWQETWQLLEENWGKDIGCPEGAFLPLNVDAKLNAAYVVMGLLYGEGDIEKTLELVTRAGQNTKGNAATAATILGTMKGLEQIPAHWVNSLSQIEKRPFRPATYTLEKACDVSYRLALEMIRKNGGQVDKDKVRINWEEPVTVPFEQNFTGLQLTDSMANDKILAYSDTPFVELPFSGKGIVLKGKVENLDHPNKSELNSKSETLNRFVLKVKFAVDSLTADTVHLPLNYSDRALELYYNYGLPEGNHILKMEILNPNPKVVLKIGDLLSY